MIIKQDLPVSGPCTSALIAWNTLDPRARTNDFNRSLQAEVRDPLWMLTRQWQWGEFDGEDAGTAIFSRLSWQNSEFTAFAAGANGAANDFNSEYAPLEASAERLFLHTLEQDLGLRLELGRQFMKILTDVCQTVGIQVQAAAWFNDSAYSIKPTPKLVSNDPETVASYALDNADSEYWAVWNAVSGRAVDGLKVYRSLFMNLPLTNPQGLPVVKLKEAFKAFGAWVKRMYYEPDGSMANEESSWTTEKLEYQFKCGAPNTDPLNPQKLVMVADSFRSGTLDWYAMDFSTLSTSLQNVPPINYPDFTGMRTLVPSKMTFDGMPHPRWWTFENGAVSFGNIDVNTNDLARMILMDFMLNYSNDWYLIPFAVKTGTIVNLQGIEVTDVFGVRTLVKTANANAGDTNSNAWSLFTHDIRSLGVNPPDTRFFLAPKLATVLESNPLESITFFRDEMANLVWGVEQTIPNRLLGGMDGQTAAQIARERMEALIPPLPPLNTQTPEEEDEKAKLRYRLATTVPENYIPFLPVQISLSTSEIQLQRGSIPREINLQMAGTVAPRSALLRKRDFPNYPGRFYPLYLNEEEVPRTGASVITTWQRTRWHNGRTFVWLGRKNQTSGQIRPSGLQFDRLETNDL